MMSLPNKSNALDSGSYASKITIFFGKTNEFCPENFGIFAENKINMEYINEFHKQWMETTRQSIESWEKQPISLEEKKRQQEMLNQQKVSRENRLKG